MTLCANSLRTCGLMTIKFSSARASSHSRALSRFDGFAGSFVYRRMFVSMKQAFGIELLATYQVSGNTRKIRSVDKSFQGLALVRGTIAMLDQHVAHEAR